VSCDARLLPVGIQGICQGASTAIKYPLKSQYHKKILHFKKFNKLNVLCFYLKNDDPKRITDVSKSLNLNTIMLNYVGLISDEK
jgi:hypothetical protein